MANEDVNLESPQSQKVSETGEIVEGSQAPVVEKWQDDQRYKDMPQEQLLDAIYKSEREAEKRLGSIKDELGQLREKTSTADLLRELVASRQNQQVQDQPVQPQLPTLTDEQKTAIQDDPSSVIPIMQKMMVDTMGPITQQIAGQTNRTFLMQDLKGMLGARYQNLETHINDVLRNEPTLLTSYSNNPAYVTTMVAQLVRGAETMAMESGTTAPHTPKPGVTAGASTVAQPAPSGELSQDDAAVVQRMGLTPELVKLGREMKKKQQTWTTK